VNEVRDLDFLAGFGGFHRWAKAVKYYGSSSFLFCFIDRPTGQVIRLLLVSLNNNTGHKI
jgi:hypothetical protein